MVLNAPELSVAYEDLRHYDPELRAFHQRLTKRGKHYKQASCALAAKIRAPQ